jgi:hypothetical protein
VRVAADSATVGASESGTILEVTGTTRLVHVALDPADATYLKPGGPVTVTLADNSSVQGVVQSLGSTAVVSSSSNNGNGGGGGGGNSTSIDLWISLPHPPARVIDESPVTVAVATNIAQNVLAVPTNSLVALSEGGYAVQVVDSNGGSHLVGVTTGQFANGMVEVRGNIAVGDKVVTA